MPPASGARKCPQMINERGLRVGKIARFLQGAARRRARRVGALRVVINRAFEYPAYLDQMAVKGPHLTVLFVLFRKLRPDRNPYSWKDFEQDPLDRPARFKLPAVLAS
jgi:hypothetical protein